MSTILYNKPGIPHKGWTCLNPDGDDTGEISHQCEMCGTNIRYLYDMVHPDYPTKLTVGSECTLNMSEDYEQIQIRKKLRTSRRNKLQHFINNGWQLKFDRWMRTYHGYTVSITYTNGHYRYAIFADKRPWHFKTMDEAKRASFDYITKRLS
jgi:hypothetical protein